MTRERRPQRLRALLKDPVAREILQQNAAPFPDDAGAWLANLALLTGLPFNTMVPVASMLPPESIRFFYIDPNWIDAAIDGALSVANVSEQNVAMLELLGPAVKEAAVTSSSGVWTGFLLSSVAVSDFPGLLIGGYSDAAGTQPLPLLRLDLLSPTVMIAIFDGPAASFSITKPSHLMHFGVEDPLAAGSPLGAEGSVVYLRGIGGTFPAGTSVSPSTPVSVALRPPVSAAYQILDVNAMQSALQSALAAAYDSSLSPLGSAAFALQMVAAAETQLFTIDPEKSPR